MPVGNSNFGNATIMNTIGVPKASVDGTNNDRKQSYRRWLDVAKVSVMFCVISIKIKRPVGAATAVKKSADACGSELGELARETAVRMCQDLDEDFEVLLLRDIRDLFDLKHEDRLPSAVIIENLNLLPHGLWSDWRGKHDTDTPRSMTQGIMAKLLAPFGIRPATIWPLRRTADTKSSRGYHRHQFEDAWARYCQPEGDSRARCPKVKSLRSR
jgi:hypothetical protein